MADAKAGTDMDSSSPFFFLHVCRLAAVAIRFRLDGFRKGAQYFHVTPMQSSRLVLSIGRPLKGPVRGSGWHGMAWHGTR
jgi:hypothetical protein